MRVIPVIDLLGHLVVHGVGGNREQYRPIVSPLSDSASPGEVARALAQAVTAREIYVADLDAIGGAEPNWEALQKIASKRMRLLLDAGVATADQAQSLLAGIKEFATQSEFAIESAVDDLRIVVGLETLAAPDELLAICQQLSPARIVLSIDLRSGVPMTQIQEWRQATPQQIMQTAIEAGVVSFIILDLAGVGSTAGVPTLDLCRWLRAAAPKVEIISGGGVRGMDDLVAMKQAGCDAALVATALHNGAIGKKEIDSLRDEP